MYGDGDGGGGSGGGGGDSRGTGRTNSLLNGTALDSRGVLNDAPLRNTDINAIRYGTVQYTKSQR